MYHKIGFIRADVCFVPVNMLNFVFHCEEPPSTSTMTSMASSAKCVFITTVFAYSETCKPMPCIALHTANAISNKNNNNSNSRITLQLQIDEMEIFSIFFLNKQTFAYDLYTPPPSSSHCIDRERQINAKFGRWYKTKSLHWNCLECVFLFCCWISENWIQIHSTATAREKKPARRCWNTTTRSVFFFYFFFHLRRDRNNAN